MKLKLFLISLLVLLVAPLSQAEDNTRKLTGRIVNKDTNKPVAFSTIYVLETERGTVADVNGKYILSLPKEGNYHLRVSCMGYATQEIWVKPHVRSLIIKLEEQSIALEEFTVTARYHDKLGSDATVGQEALEYIQPTSLRDVFTLLPGGKITSNNMQGGELITSRQAGADKSTSFGMGISIDGIPMSNDGMRVQMSGLTGQTAMDQDANITVNAGIDMRTISTDHMESVTVARGISSAKEGNLSSGMVRVTPKKGESPIRARVKADPKNKLVYVGKGIRLGESAGTLYVGADMVHSTSSIEDRRGAYNRLTAQANYNNQVEWWGKRTDISVFGSYVTSFNNRKTDEMIEARKEKYSTRYQRASLSTKIKSDLNGAIADNVEMVLSADYSNSLLKHHKTVSNTTVTPLQQSTEEGEHEGTFLPSTYQTFYKLDNQPVNAFAQLTAQKYGTIGSHVNYSYLYGASYTCTKNVGLGAVTDPLRPPFPSESYIRPRRNRDIPALMHMALYAETKWGYTTGLHELNTSLGLRDVMMFNLPSHYELQNKMLLEPRVQASYTLSTPIGDKKMRNSVRVGYGMENKLPSADYLYPDLVYHDFIALNAYFSDESKRLLITNTKIQDPTNPNLRENKNRKIEIGYDWEYKEYAVSLTLFKEQMSNGVEYFTTYTPTSYTYYYELKHPVDGRPSRDDFNSRLMETFMMNRTPANSAKIVKRGLEYRIHIPTIRPIHSEIEINGAYYHTLYTDGIPVMYRPSIMLDGNMYPYVGIFDGFEKKYRSTFNTNIWINTHLPKWKLIFTNFMQIVWFETSRLGKDVDVYPSHYMDLEGRQHVLDEAALAANPELELLKRDFKSSRYNEARLPASFLWNLKLTKEFNKWLKLSLFADNIINVNPKYKDAYLKTQRVWVKPFFGVELTLNIL